MNNNDLQIAFNDAKHLVSLRERQLDFSLISMEERIRILRRQIVRQGE